MFAASEYLLLLLGIFFLVSAFFSFLINWLFLKFSFNLGTRDKDGEGQVRWARNIKPSTGGISFFIVFLISLSVVGTLPRPDLFFDTRLVGIVAACCLGFVLGLADDAYNTNPLAKFIAQLSCAFILILSDIYIKATGNHAIDFLLTTFWVVGLMNSVNMLDNMDAITSTASMSIIVGLISVIAINYTPADIYFLMILISVLGALTGFLYFNWNPSKIIMGDTGSQFLGVFLSSMSILLIWNVRDENTTELIQLKQFVLPMLFFIVPLLDTTTVTIRRLLRKQSPFVGGKDHITHHLAYLGLSDKWVAVVLIAGSLASLPLSLLLLLGIVEWNWVVTFSAFAYFAVVFIIFQILYNIGGKKKRQATLLRRLQEKK